MAMSLTLQKFLAREGAAYDIVPHRHTDTTMNAAHAAHVPAQLVAKPVILEDESGYVMVVIPADHHVKIAKVNRQLGRNMGLATEAELKDLFTDCEPGAIPAVGEAYGMETLVDDSLCECPDVYLEAGDHEDFIHMRGRTYRRLMRHAQHGHVC